MALKNLLGDSAATDDALIMLRRLCDLLESNSIVDQAGRQRVIVDTAPTTAVTVSSGTVTTVTTVTTVSNVGTVAGYDHRQFGDQARIAYNNGIRANLIFS